MKVALLIAVIFLTCSTDLLSSVGAGNLAGRMEAQSQTPDRNDELKRATELSAQTVTLYNEKKYREALPLAQQVVEIYQRLLSPNDPRLGVALRNLGQVYLAAKKDNDAEKVLQAALAVYELQPTNNEVVIIELLNDLAYIRFRKHDYDQTEALLLRSLEMKERVFGATNPKTIEAMKSYACFSLRSTLGRRDLGSEPDENKRSLRARASCWIISDDCENHGQVEPGGILNGKALELARPQYPQAARGQRLAGPAFVAVTIDENGRVVRAQPVCGGYPLLNEAGVAAARASKFSATTLNGQPVKVTGVITYNFVAQ